MGGGGGGNASTGMRPIMLTAAAASLALIPIAREIFWGPMAYAMMGGIIVGTLLTLLFLPALYVAWFRIKEPDQAPCSKVAELIFGVQFLHPRSVRRGGQPGLTAAGAPIKVMDPV